MLFSGDRDKAPRTRGGGLGWQKRALLACSLVCLAGSLTVYATSAAALAGQWAAGGGAAAAAAGILTPVTGATATEEETQAPDDGAAGTVGPEAINAGAGSDVLGSEGAPNEGQVSADAAAEAGVDGAAAADAQDAAPVFPVMGQDGAAKDAAASTPAGSSGGSSSTDAGKKPSGTSGASKSSNPSTSSGSKPSGTSKGSSSSPSSTAPGSSPASGATSSGGGSSSSGNAASTGSPASSGSSASSPSSSGGSTSASDTGTTVKPAASSSTSLSDAAEEKIYKQLSAKYNALAPLAADVASACSTFDSTVDDATAAERKSALAKAKQLYTKVSEASSAMQSVSVPAKSKYHGKYADMLILYDDLTQASDILRRAWAVACGSVDVSGKTEPRQVVAAYADKSGKLEVLKDYEDRYPGARP